MGELSYTVGGDSNLVSFKSAARVPITSLKAHFKPKQDLHGYSKPWPAGGGNNIWDEQWEIGGLDSITGAPNTENNRIRSKNYIPVIPNTSYYFLTAAKQFVCFMYDENQDVLTWPGETNNYKIISNNTFTTSSDTKYIKFYCTTSYGTTYNNDIAINYPSTVTTYSPYENICPIEGWNSAKIYTTGEELPFISMPGITDSLGVHFVVDNNGIITADGTPTSWSQVMCKKYVVNGDEILYGRIIGNLKNVTNVMPQLYDENGTRLYYGKFGDDIFNTYLDLKQYPGVKTVIVGVKRLSNGIPVTGQGTFVLTKGSQKPVNSVSITFPITGKNLFNFDLSTSSLVKMDYHDNIFQNNATDTRTVPNLQVQLMKTITSYIKPGGSSFPSTTGRTSFTFVVDTEECKYVRFKHNGATCDLGVCIPFEYGLGTYTISFDLLRTDPSTIGGFSFKDIQIERGTAATAYEPYSSDNIFYGGYIDPAAGEAQPTWYLYTITGDETFYDGGAWISAFVPVGLQASSIDSLKNIGYCTHYQYGAYKSNKIGVMYDERTITFDASVRTAAEWKAFCKAEYEKGTPIQLCYPLREYQQALSIKKNDIIAFINNNNVWSNTNSNTEVSYALHDAAPIRAAKHRIAANEPHLVTAQDKLVNFRTDLAAPLKSCKVNFEPKQDLHGYDGVWIGGNGKNLFNVNAEFANPSDTTLANTTARIFTPGTYCLGISHTNYFISGNVTTCTVVDNALTVNTKQGYGVGFPLKLTAGSTYYMSATIGNNEVGRIGAAYYDASGNYLSGISIVSGNYGIRNSSFTIPTDADITVIIFASENADTTFTNIQLELGSTATSYSPYENICPINGWTGCEVYRTGNNLFDPTKLPPTVANFYTEEDGYFHIQNNYNLGWKNQQTCLFLQPGTYTASLKRIGGDADCSAEFRSSEGGWVWESWGVPTRPTKTYTDSRNMAIRLTGVGNTVGLQIELGTVATEFEPYQGTTIPLDWSNSAGTIYGGYVDLINGELTQTMGYIALSDLIWHYRNGCFDGIVSNGKRISYKTNQAKVICDSYNQIGAITNYASLKNGECAFGSAYINANTCTIIIKDSSYSNLEDFFESLSGKFIAYELQTPITYQLTLTQLKSLKGVNNIWSDANGNVEVSYWTH